MLIKNSKKIVIKLGSSTVVDSKGNFKKAWVKSLIKDIKKFRERNDLVIVSSGAIALGQNYLKIKKKNQWKKWRRVLDLASTKNNCRRWNHRFT